MEKVKERRLPGQLLKILDDYLSDRRIVIHCQEGKVERNIYAGVPQGSVLEPLLWNLVYDGLLMALDSINAFAFADDLALVITTRKTQEIGDRDRGLVKIVADWCNDAGLRLAMQKTEVILLTGKRVPKVFNLDVGGGEITTKEAIRYLGVTLDNARGYSSHFEQVCEKAERFLNAIRSLLPNANGPVAALDGKIHNGFRPVIPYKNRLPIDKFIIDPTSLGGYRKSIKIRRFCHDHVFASTTGKVKIVNKVENSATVGIF